METAGPIRVRRSRRRPRGPAGGPLQGKAVQNGGMRWFRRTRAGRKRSNNDAEESNAMSEGGLSGDDKDEEDRTRQVPELQYSREKLMKLRSHPLANERPACLDTPNNEAIERWHGDRKRSETPTEEDSRRRGDSAGNAEKRRSNDPRERVRKEQDGIVLSPQRRSFNSGCFVPTTQSSAVSGRRPESPIGKPESNLILGRDIGHRELSNARRIGSGRIPARESSWELRDPSWEMREAVWDQLDANLAPEHGSFRPGGGSASSGPMSRSGDLERSHRERDGDLRHDNRRPRFGWDFPRDREGDRERERDRDRDLEKDRFDKRFEKGRNERHDRIDDRMTDRSMRRNDREDRRDDRRDRDDRYGRRRHDSREEEPEWFSAGPTSQHDTIELRGFEDIPEDGQVTGRGKKNTRTKANSRVTPATRKSSDSSISSGRTATTPPPQEAAKKNSPDGKGDKSDKSRASGPLATSSPDTKEKKAKQLKSLNDASGDGKDVKGKLESESAQVENGKAGRTSETPQLDFNLDEFLKSDSLPLMMNGGQAEAASGGSRFRQWFSKNSPTNDDIVRAVPDDLNNMLQDLPETVISIPAEKGLDNFFAPISPAANTHQKQQLIQQQLQARLAQQNQPNKLLEMLRRGSDSQSHPAPGEIPSIKDLEASGKIHSVEELEARMRPKSLDAGGAMPPVREPRLADPAIASVVHHGGLPPMLQQREDEVAAFKKLIMKRNQEPQVGSEAPGGANNAMMNAFTGVPPPFNSVGSAHTQSQQMQIPEDLLVKLLQVQQQQQQHPHHTQQHLQQQQQQRLHQQDMLTKIMNNARMSQQQQQQQQMHQPHQMHQQSNRRQGQMMQPGHYSGHSSNRSPLPPEVQSLIANTPLNHDLLQRAEAQAIIRGLMQGEITIQHLVQQLQNPAITRRHQELLLSILKTHSLKGSGDFMGQRVPSPRDMALHNQNMQSALIKKKLEEQKETLRKRQEPHRSLSPNIGNFNAMNKNDMKHPMSSPSPLAFTPTSVLKKMNAEKDGDQKIGGLPAGITLNELQQMQQVSRQPSMQISASQVQQQQQQPPQHRLPQNWNQNKSQNQPQGRPILKSSNNFSYSGNDTLSQPGGASQNHPQQVQALPAYMRGGPPPSQFPRSKMTMSTPPPNMAQQPPQYNMNMMQARPGLSQSSNPRGQHMQPHPSGMQNHQHHNTSTLQQMLMGNNFSQNHKSEMSHGGSGDVGSNGNQLSRWFSPQLLAQARSGPSVPAQGMLSVEDIERLQQAVHN